MRRALALLAFAACSSEKATCETTPLAESCMADASLTIFVSPSGSDIQGDGSRKYPLQTIGAALGKITQEGGPRRHIYVCGDEYDENLNLDASHAGLLLAGGLDCTWKPNGSRVLIGASFAGPPPIQIDAPGAGVVVYGVEAHATSANYPDGYSDTVVAVATSDVTFRNVHLVASRGSDGTIGAAGTTFTGDDLCNRPAGPGGGVRCCFGGSSVGGNPGGSGMPGGTPNGGLANTACDSGGAGSPGQAGADGAPAATGALQPGNPLRLQFNGTMSYGSGPSGGAGNAGQGGGGGGALTSTSFAGAGGAGGCGGIASGGSGGGNSIAIVAGGQLAVYESILEVSDGGAGGAGIAGAPGEGPYQAGVPGNCSGGSGGAGGNGGASGGGAGGLSVAIVYDTTHLATPDPVIDAATMIVLGQPGKGGVGGAPGLDGVDGIAAATHAF